MYGVKNLPIASSRVYSKHVPPKYSIKTAVPLSSNQRRGVADNPNLIPVAVLNGRKRTVDFNQGIDARLITKKLAQKLALINVHPIRLAFDYDKMEKPYLRAIKYLVDSGFRSFTNYVMFNFNDDPHSFYNRLKINADLSYVFDARVTSFPMRYIPIDALKRGYISKKWRWRYMRGIQCILLATHGLVSPNPEFFKVAFGESYDEFMEIISMPDRYIIYRNKYKDDAKAWRKRFRRMSQSTKEELYQILENLGKTRSRRKEIQPYRKFRGILEHYYPNGFLPHE